MSKISLNSIVTLWVSTASLALLLVASLPVRAQESQGCFMTDSTGRVIPLGGLCSGVTTPTVQHTYRATIKRRIQGIPVIDVTFNGNQTYEMIVDTGASGTLITLPMANALRIQAVGVATASIADGSQVKFPVGIIKTMAVGGAVVKDIPVAIAEKMDIGLLGHDFFGGYDVKIRQNVVEFQRQM